MLATRSDGCAAAESGVRGVNSNPLPQQLSMPPSHFRTYPKGLMPHCRPYGANEYDDCLEREYRDYVTAFNSELGKRKEYLSAPWVSMPPEGRRFRPITSTPLTSFQTAGVFNGLDVVVLQMRVPLGYDGVISDVVLNFTGSGFDEGSGEITWRIAADYLPIGGLQVGGRYLRDMGNVITSLGSLTQPSPVPRGGLRVYSWDLVTVYCNIASTATVANGVILASLAGWTWPR